jgi:hypothetical protein
MGLKMFSPRASPQTFFLSSHEMSWQFINRKATTTKTRMKATTTTRIAMWNQRDRRQGVSSSSSIDSIAIRNCARPSTLFVCLSRLEFWSRLVQHFTARKAKPNIVPRNEILNLKKRRKRVWGVGSILVAASSSRLSGDA